MPTVTALPPAADAAPARIVLDTNVVMDWLVFDDPDLRGIARAIEARLIVWLTSSELHGEFAHVLGRGVAAAWAPHPARIFDHWHRHSLRVAQPLANAGGRGLRCSDPDDQKFIELACCHGARWLVSRDRAVLKLARKAAAQGLEIVTPQRWTLPPAP